MGTSQLKVEIRRVTDEINSINDEKDTLQKEIEAKERAFQGVLGGVMELRRLMGEEEEQGNAKKARTD